MRTGAGVRSQLRAHGLTHRVLIVDCEQVTR
jgi:hypothetical protein